MHTKPLLLARTGRAFPIAALAAALALSTGVAQADFAEDIAGFVQAMDDTPGWIANYNGVEATQDGGTVEGLVIRSIGRGAVLSVNLQALELDGYQISADGEFSADSIRVGEVRLDIGPTQVILADVSLDALAAPDWPELALDPKRPMTAIAKLYGAIATLALDRGRIGSATVEDRSTEAHSDITYSDIAIGTIRGGVVSRIATGPVSLAAVDGDEIVTFQIGAIDSIDTDLSAFARVMDPDRYVGGHGDGRWRQVLALAEATDIAVSTPDGRIEVGRYSLENLRMRQPPQSFTPMFDAILSDPDMPEPEADALSRRHLIDYFSSFSIGRTGFDELTAVGSGIDRFRLGGLRILDTSIEGIGEIAVSDVEVAVPEVGEVTLRRASIGDFVLPDVELLRESMAETDPRASDDLPFTIRVGFMEVIGVRLFSPGRIDLALARSRADLAGYIGQVPTSMVVQVNGLEVDSSIIDDRRVRVVLSRLGFDTLSADYGYRLYWREIDERLMIEGLHMTIANAGTVTIDVEMSGITRADLEDPDRLSAALEHLTFETATVRVTDNSMLDRVFEMQASQLGIQTRRLKEQVVNALPFFLIALQNPDFQKRLATELKDFVLAPGTLLMEARPSAPLPLQQVIDAAIAAPQSLPDLLNVRVRNQ